MPMLFDLADACRASGLRVVETPGWRTRGHGQMSSVETVVCHHTATPASAPGDYPSLRIVRDGRTGLPGPLSQLGLGRSGRVYVIAAGLAYHAGATRTSAESNGCAIGIEAEHPGGSTPWGDRQYDAYVRLCAALCEHYRLTPARVLGHREVAVPPGRKPDPTFDLAAFRRRVTDLMEDDMPYTDWPQRDRDALVGDVVTALLKTELGNGETVRNNLRRAGDTRALAREIKRELDAK